MAASDQTPSVIKNLFSFFQLCGKLKHLKRTGWVNHNVKEPETVAGHMYRMAMMGFLIGGGSGGSGNLDRERCIRMALVHDLAESIVGDITPDDDITREEKYRRELEGMEHIKSLVPEQVGVELCELWKEYEEGTSPEAIFVKDLDKFDMIFQAFEYERSQDRLKELQQFFDSTKGKFKHPVVKEWVDQLMVERNSCDPDVCNKSSLTGQ